MNKNLNDRLVELYAINSGELKSHTVSSINATRDEAIEKFIAFGLPTRRDESYKYSNISSWLESAASGELSLSSNCNDSITIEQSSEGVVVCDINTFAANYGDIFNKYYTKSVEDDSLMMLSRAFVSGGRVIYVPSRTICDNLIRIRINSCEDELTLGVRDLFIFEKDSLAKIHISHHHKGVVNRVCEVFVESGANIEISEEYYGSENSVVVNTLSAKQMKDSFYKHITLNLSCGKMRCNEYVSLSEQGAETSIFGAVSAKGKAHIDNTTVVKHMVENCRSYESFKYVANDTATAVFSGNVFVAQKANGTQAYQQNNNILLSDTANIYSKPNLEIYADDVKCSHGATVGQLDEEALFYMRQRGIYLEDAKKLLLRGFLKDIVDKISNKELIEEIGLRLDENI